MRRWLVIGGATLGGLLAGAVLTLALQTTAQSPEPPGDNSRAIPVTKDQAPTTFLVWVPRGLPSGFAREVSDLPKVHAVTIVAEDDAWLRRSWNAAGELVDDPPPSYRIPIDVAAIDPSTFAAFVPPADRASIGALAEGDAILGATSATLRGLGPGSLLDFGRGKRVRVTAILPDELVGAAEVMVSRETGARIGIEHDRYFLVQPAQGRRISPLAFRARIRPLLPRTLGVDRAVQVRAPGQTPFFRAGDAVLPPVLVKSLFGEFAARRGERPGTLELDPAWMASHLETTTVPVFGRITCNRGLVEQLRAAMTRVEAAGLSGAVTSFHGCFVPRHIGWDADNMISYHSWGIAFDVNLATNVRGETPHQDPRLVRILSRWGFQWGGSWIVPDGNHFEFHRTVTRRYQ
jgi:hypothetical protein